MKTEDILAYAEKLAKRALETNGSNEHSLGLLASAREFLRAHVGNDNEFYGAILFLDEKKPNGEALASVLRSFQEYIKEGFSVEFTPREEAEINVVSDFLEQARILLQDKKVHPAAACVLIGATLEEYLRNWVSRESLKIGNRKAGIAAYSDALSKKNLISKQDLKDILSWSGLRNEAAHGKWAEISSRERAKLMLEGVNLFIRTYSRR